MAPGTAPGEPAPRTINPGQHSGDRCVTGNCGAVPGRKAAHTNTGAGPLSNALGPGVFGDTASYRVSSPFSSVPTALMVPLNGYTASKTASSTGPGDGDGPPDVKSTEKASWVIVGTGTLAA